MGYSVDGRTHNSKDYGRPLHRIRDLGSRQPSIGLDGLTRCPDLESIQWVALGGCGIGVIESLQRMGL